MKRPLIGITIDGDDEGKHYDSPVTYAGAVEKAGGLPFLLPYKIDRSLIPQIVDSLDGILFSGGNDLSPALYGQPLNPNAIPIDPDRQNFELALLAEVEKRRKPTLGVCLGSQVMNVYRGGSLHQFLPEVPREPLLEHRRLGKVLFRHNVHMNPDSLLGRAIGQAEVSVNTYHKQAIDRVGNGLKIVGTAPDGVIEAFEDPTFPLFAAVQWHPERIADEPAHLNLFKLLVEKAAAHPS